MCPSAKYIYVGELGARRMGKDTMNILDGITLGIFALYLLVGYYHGFLRTVFQLTAFFLALLMGVALSAALRGPLLKNELIASMNYYIEGSEYLGNNMELARIPVGELSAEQGKEIVASTSLPYPLPKLLEQNLATEAFVTDPLSDVAYTVTGTVVHFTVNVLSFFLAFLALRLALAAGIIGYDQIKGLPVLRAYDSLLGAGFGLVRAFFSLFVLAVFIPVALSFLQQMGGNNIINVKLTTLIQESKLMNFFYYSNFILPFIKGV